jgi:glycerate kinase
VKVVLAVDKFKGSASAPEVCAALRHGLAAALPEVDIVDVPVGDGGDGSLDALLSAGFAPVPVTACGPLGSPQPTRFGMRGVEAFVELAEVCGIQLLPRGALRPWSSSTYGLGQVVLAAVSAGARRITLGLGGSASTDGGLGLLLALGATVRDAAGRAVTPDAFGMAAAASVDLGTLDPRLRAVDLVAATDVDNPLTGRRGAARVFGPQKGAAGGDVEDLDRALDRWATRLVAASGRRADVPGGGAAGGVGAAVVSALGGVVTDGASYVLDAVGFDTVVPDAACVVTGEGCWDEQTAGGKLPQQVLDRASAAGVPVIVVAGRIAPEVALDPPAVVARHALLDLEPAPERAMAEAPRLLEEVGRRIGSLLAAGAPV